MRKRYPCTFLKACHVQWCVKVAGMTQTQAAILCGLNVGTVCHVIHGRRFYGSYPVPIA